MAREMACEDTKCGWIGSENDVEWFTGDDYSADETMACPKCLGGDVRPAQWWMAIVCTKDWYTMLDKIKIIEAPTALDATSMVESKIKGFQHIEYMYGPFDDKPQEC